MPGQLKPFQYFEPSSINEAFDLLSKHEGSIKIIAGGLDLIPRLRRHLIAPEYVMSINKIPELDSHLDKSMKGLRFGALTTLRSLERNNDIQNDYLALYEAVHQIASVQVKNMGTLIGNLCVATPASDVATALIALDSELEIGGPDGKRYIPVEQFFKGANQHILKPNEIAKSISISQYKHGTGSVFFNLVRTSSDIAKVIVAVKVTVVDNVFQMVRIALGAVAPTPIRITEAESLLEGKEISPNIIEEAAKVAVKTIKPISDLRSTSEYRIETTKVLIIRALIKASERATGHNFEKRKNGNF